MKISFDADNPREVAAVRAALDALTAPAAMRPGADAEYLQRSRPAPDGVLVAEGRTVEMPSTRYAKTAAAPTETGTDAATAFAAPLTSDAAAAFGAPPFSPAATSVPTPAVAAPPPPPTSTAAPSGPPSAPAPTVSPTDPADLYAVIAGQAPPPAGVPLAPVPAPAGGPEVDKQGLPWDARIHSGPADKRPKNADGTWRRRRGSTDEEVRAVEAELRYRMGLTAPAPVPPPPPSVPTPPPAAPVAAPPAPPSITSAAPGATGPASGAGAPSDFAGLMAYITAQQTLGKLPIGTVMEKAQAFGLANGLRDLVARPDLVPAFFATLPTE